MVRLHVHRRPAVPFGQGEDSWAGPPDLACTFGHGDNQDQPRCCAAGPTTSATPVCKHTLSWLRYFVNWRLSRWLRKKTPLEVREAGFSPICAGSKTPATAAGPPTDRSSCAQRSRVRASAHRHLRRISSTLTYHDTELERRQRFQWVGVACRYRSRIVSR
jgi:hypothetical protein